MNKILFIALFVLLLWPVKTRAQLVDDPYDFHYQFQFIYQGGKLVENGGYLMATGVTAPTSGNWHLELLGPHNEVLGLWPFNPTANRNRPFAFLPYAPNGTTLRVTDERGRQALRVDLTSNRICNDDGRCELDDGEDSETCPNDCAGVVVAPMGDTAAIGQQAGVQSVLGLVLFRLGLAGAGFLGLFIAFRTLDSRRRQ